MQQWSPIRRTGWSNLLAKWSIGPGDLPFYWGTYLLAFDRHGPYATKGAAYDAIEALDWKVWNCGNCRPISISQMIGGEEVSVG